LKKAVVMKFTPLFLLLLLTVASAQPSLSPELGELYRWFHAHPEISNNEEKTASRLADELEKMGLQVHRGIGGHGVMAVLRGQAGGPVVLYRADMDALPIEEATGLPYASQNQGVMHACGHDIHMTVAVGALQKLSQTREDWSGTVVFIGQPAEEVGSGAEAMLADPRFHKVLQQAGGDPKFALALHDYAALPAGTAVLTPGFVTANVDSIDITVFGKGGHGAAPDTAVDPVVIGAEVVTALQTIVSRKLPPGTRAVVTVGKFQSGTKRNIIPAEARLELTVRSYEDDIRKRLIKEIERIAQGVSTAHGATRPPEVYHHAQEYTPAGFNDPEWARRLRSVFVETIGEDAVLELPPSMVGEDFSEYSRALEIPTVMFLLGAADPSKFDAGEPLPALHSDLFAPDYQKAIPVGIELVLNSLLEALQD
jgi:hippurate hydrolase